MIDTVKIWANHHYKITDPLFVEQLPFRITNDDEPTEIFTAELVLVDSKLVAFYFMPNADQRFLNKWLKTQEAHLKVFDDVWLCITPPSLTSVVLSSDDLTGLLVVDRVGTIVNARTANSKSLINKTALVEIFNQQLDLSSKTNLKTAPKSNPMLQHIRRASVGGSNQPQHIF